MTVIYLFIKFNLSESLRRKWALLWN